MSEELAFRVTELERRVANLLRVATVSALDEAAARVKVAAGGLTSGWLPWLTRRAGPDSDWWAPEPGEQVLLLAPGGETEQAVVLPALYQTAHPAPGTAKTVRRVAFSDGGFGQYDREVGALEVEAVGPMTLTAGEKTTVTAGATIELDGGSAALKGLVQGDCICPFIRKPHLHLSGDVKASKG